jgi:GNAT superfamily N-acetyltransferase
MLIQVAEPAKSIEGLAESKAHAYVFRRYCEFKHDNTDTAVVLGDSAKSPRILLAHYGGNMLVQGDPQAFAAAAEDLLYQRVEQDPPWSLGAMQDATLEKPDRPALFCNSTPVGFWEALKDAGFEVNPEDKSVAYTWMTEGEPRFSHLVEHPCRLGEGEELHQYVRQGISYDPEGYYTRLCLQNGPSFVCEVDGEPVCWSATHLSGTMAMIYTPPEHRRKGYARSLGAFQIDFMLKHHGLACCHIISTNTPSNELIRTFGFVRVGAPLVWRNVVWPESALKQA